MSLLSGSSWAQLNSPTITRGRGLEATASYLSLPEVSDTGFPSLTSATSTGSRTPQPRAASFPTSLDYLSFGGSLAQANETLAQPLRRTSVIPTLRYFMRDGAQQGEDTEAHTALLCSERLG
ncbi:hypothetical protein Bca4012_020447 [Brassica carinata]